MQKGPLTAAFSAALVLWCPSPSDAQELPLHVLLQGTSAPELAGLVTNAGGSVSHDLPIINAVGARLSREQLDNVLLSDKVLRHMDDLGEDDPEEEDEETCRVRGHIELTMDDSGITWPLYNKLEAPQAFQAITLAWPGVLGELGTVAIGDTLLDPDTFEATGEHSVVVNFPAEQALEISGRKDLAVTFTRPEGLAGVQQADFQIAADFGDDCTTDLVRGYENNHGDFYYNTVSGAEALHLEGIRGQGITVAVVDSGLWEHPALMLDTAGKPRVLARYDAIRNVADEEVLDESGHGTHMTSIIANSDPTIRNGKPAGSFKGVAPDARIVAVKILDREGRAQLLDIVRSIQWVVDNRERYGIRVLNLSFAQIPSWHYWDDPVNQAVMRAWAEGIVVVAAAGNDGPDPMTIGSPGNLPYVITVGAVTDSWTIDTRDDDYIPDFSSRGPTESGHIKPDVVALGGHMTGLVHPDSDLAESAPEDILATGEYTSTGSSQAAALVSGITALLLQLQPDLTPDDIKCKFITSAEPAINRDGLLSYSPFEQGYGYVTATRAVTLGDTGCGNADFDLEADLRGEGQFFGPAILEDDGSTTLPGLDSMVSPGESAKGPSDTRKWGVKDHVERPDARPEGPNPPAEAGLDWEAIYRAERDAIRRLAEGEPAAP